MSALRFVSELDPIDSSIVEEGAIDESQQRQGLWIRHAGEDLTRTEYLDGKKHGTHLLFRNDVLIVRVSFRDGKHSGPFQYFYEDGSPNEFGEYVNGEMLIREWWRRDGEQTLFNGTGFKDEEYGSEIFRSVYRKYYVDGFKVSELKFSGPEGPA
jgi:antitoxin component YwqK of YwqJK toxin-antitoxin module